MVLRGKSYLFHQRPLLFTAEIAAKKLPRLTGKNFWQKVSSPAKAIGKKGFPRMEKFFVSIHGNFF
jgi:hypothetical protein